MLHYKFLSENRRPKLFKKTA